jgi:microcystin-dependent protein
MEFLHIIVMILVLINIYLVYTTRNLDNFSTKLSSIETFDTSIDNAINDTFRVNFDSIRTLSSFASEIINETELITMNDNTYFKDGIINSNLKIDGKLKVEGNIKFTNKDTKILNIFPKYMIIAWGDIIVPLGWALCDGRIYYMDNDGNAVLSPTPSYPQGLLTPNLQGRMILGAGSGTNFTPKVLNQKGGVEKVVLNDVKYLPNHDHVYPHKWDWDNALGTGYPDVMEIRRKGQRTKNNNYGKSDGTVEPHENMPPFYVLNYIIKL